jgi:hypothetical protein
MRVYLRRPKLTKSSRDSRSTDEGNFSGYALERVKSRARHSELKFPAIRNQLLDRPPAMHRIIRKTTSLPMVVY